MKKAGAGILFISLIVSIIFSQFKLSNHPITDNDEGIYLTSFLLINKGHPAYKETYFSQPPGFLLSAYPGFYVLGRTLPAARLTIGFWSIIGLFAIGWIGFEFGSIWIGLLTVSILYCIRYYTNQTLTLQSDIIVSTFSLLSFGSILRFLKSQKPLWLCIAGFFLNLAFWTKFDVTLFPAYLATLFYLPKSVKISKLSYMGIVSIISVIFFIIFILPFGFKEVFQNSLLLRFQSITQSNNPFLLFEYLKADYVLLSLVIGAFLLVIIARKKIIFPANLLVMWFFTTFVFFFFYRPLFPHHMAILSIPAVLAFSYLLYLELKPGNKIFHTLVLIVLGMSAIYYTSIVIHIPTQILSQEQQNAVDIIEKNTTTDDFVVSDEEILSALSGRLPPPELSDISYVRIRSNNLTSDRFSEIMNNYKPKLLISWNGRVKEIKSFSTILENYTSLAVFDVSREMYIRKP